MKASRFVLAITLLSMGAALPAPGDAQAQSSWNPAKQHAYMRQVCAAARTGMDKDECQYVAESLIENLGRCIRQRSPYAGTCRDMLPEAQAQLRQVNNDPVLLDHRDDQREDQRRANIRALCASQNGGYYAGAYVACVRNAGADP